MSARFGFVGGVLALTALQAVLSSSQGTSRISGAFSGVSTLIQRWSDPTIPAIPDTRAKSSAGSGGPAPSSVTPNPSAPLPTTRLPQLV